MKRLCTCFISIAILDQISFETKQKSILFSFQLKRNVFWMYSKYFGENPGTNQNFIAHVL